MAGIIRRVMVQWLRLLERQVDVEAKGNQLVMVEMDKDGKQQESLVERVQFKV